MFLRMFLSLAYGHCVEMLWWLEANCYVPDVLHRTRKEEEEELERILQLSLTEK